MSTSSPVLRSGNLGCAGRTACHASIASPTSRSTGLVNALVVLLVGTSSRHTRSPSPASGAVCQRIAPTPQAEDLVDAQAGEQPQQRDGADELERIPRRAGSAAVHVLGRSSTLEVQPGPHQLRPDVVGDHARVGPDQRRDRPGDPDRATRVEPPLDPLPLLQVAEERPDRPDQRRLRSRREHLAVAGAHRVGVQRLGQLADLQPIDGGDPRGGELAIPALGLGAVRVLGVQPAAGLDQRVVGVPASAERQRGGLKPPPRPGQPHRRDVDLAGLAAVKPLLPRWLRRERHPCDHAHLARACG